MLEVFLILLILYASLVTLYGSIMLLSENFIIGIVLLIFLPFVFFGWAFIRGLSGNKQKGS